MKLKERRAFCQAQIALYRQSGKSAEEWCKANQVNLHTLRYWITKINKINTLPKKRKHTAWVTLTDSTSQDLPGSPRLILRKGSFALEMETGCDPLLLRQVLQILANL